MASAPWPELHAAGSTEVQRRSAKDFYIGEQIAIDDGQISMMSVSKCKRLALGRYLARCASAGGSQVRE